MAPTGAIMVDNAEWLAPLNYIEFLRDVGRHFSVNRMLSMDSVKLRLEREHELSFLEFNYMILQAYDFVELARRYRCTLQIGGSDQWGNIVNGIELGRRMGMAAALRPHLPADHDLVRRQDGQDRPAAPSGSRPIRCRPTNTGSTGATPRTPTSERFLKLFTELPLDEIARLAALEGAEMNEAKKVLATEATALLHGRDAAEKASEASRRTFEEGGVGRGAAHRRGAARRARGRHRPDGAVRARRARRLQRRGAARRRQQRDQRQRREGQRSRPSPSAPPTSTPMA